jgi:hypothetical protein
MRLHGRKYCAAYAVFAVLCAWPLTSACPQIASTNLLANPGLEEPYAPVPVQLNDAIVTGLIADGWTTNSSGADLKAKLSEERNSVHGGQSAQKIEISGYRSGAICLLQEVGSLQPSNAYYFSVWCKGDQAGPIEVSIKDSSGTEISKTTCQPTASWAVAKVLFNSPASGPVSCCVTLKSNGAAWIDDSALRSAPVTK